jgi:hypothetical protein
MTDRVFLKDGHIPSNPAKVQGGYIPTTASSPAPPSGGSAVKAPQK